MLKSLGLVMLVLAGSWWTLAALAGEPATRPAKTAPAGSTQPATQPAKKLMLDLGDKVTLKLVLIPAGKFLMGSPLTVKDRFKNEDQHEVTISQPFYLGTTHVTVDQYAQFVKDPGQKHAEPNFKQTGDHPVVKVNWDEAQAFCKWLSKQSGKTVVLPTEAQWEYACRAGSKTRFSFGDTNTNLGDYSWFVENSAKMTHPVALKKPNAWGLYDMHGNAWQWTADFYAPYVAADKTDPVGPKEGQFRVARGGSWIAEPPACRSAFRCTESPNSRDGNLGFRVAVAVGGD